MSVYLVFNFMGKIVFLFGVLGLHDKLNLSFWQFRFYCEIHTKFAHIDSLQSVHACVCDDSKLFRAIGMRSCVVEFSIHVTRPSWT